MLIYNNQKKVTFGIITVCLFVLFTLNSSSQPWINGVGASPAPPSYYSLFNIGIGKNLSIPPSPLYTRHMKHWPTLLVHSQNPLVESKTTRAIIRIQDKRYEIGNDSTALWAGEPQIQFWSNEYHTMHEWWMGSIQGVADVDNQNTDIFLAKPNVAGGLAFFSRKKNEPINQGREFPVETMRILDDKVTIGAQQTENKFAVVPFGNADLADQFAIDYRVDGTDALLTKFYKATGNVDAFGKRKSYSWHIELPNINIDEEWETLGALNFCANNTSVAPGEEGESLPRLVTFLRTGKVGIKNENPKVELHVIGKASINDPDISGNKIITGTHSDYRLAVEGKLVAKEIIVTLSDWNTWPDYVFKSDYKLMPLKELEESIKLNGHLPGVPSALDIKENGINVSQVQAKMLEKIEELTLYMIEMKKRTSY